MDDIKYFDSEEDAARESHRLGPTRNTQLNFDADNMSIPRRPPRSKASSKFRPYGKSGASLKNILTFS